jgi:hypothetical protein
VPAPALPISVSGFASVLPQTTKHVAIVASELNAEDIERTELRTERKTPLDSESRIEVETLFDTEATVAKSEAEEHVVVSQVKVLVTLYSSCHATALCKKR